jgi:hypothetical protein
MKRLADLNTSIETWRGLERRSAEVLEFIELSEAEDDAGLAQDLEREVAALAAKLDR